MDDEGSDMSMTAELSFGDNCSATILASAVSDLKNKATIVGTNGKITVSKLIDSNTKKIYLLFNYYP